MNSTNWQEQIKATQGVTKVAPAVQVVGGAS
jgi:hypothetical protein